MHMIFMDLDSKLGMNLGDTYFVTENANERSATWFVPTSVATKRS